MADERYRPQGDWRDQREIHRLLGDLKADSSVEDDKWTYLGRALKAYREVYDPNCGSCGRRIEGLVIRCLDCKLPFHEEICAAQHFWPNGRPATDKPR